MGDHLEGTASQSSSPGPGRRVSLLLMGWGEVSQAHRGGVVAGASPRACSWRWEPADPHSEARPAFRGGLRVKNPPEVPNVCGLRAAAVPRSGIERAARLLSKKEDKK